MNREYVLVTPAHNEEENIEKTIKSVIAQTVQPKKWVIIDDNSSDKTGQIIKQYIAQHDFISYLYLQRYETKSYYSRRTEVFLFGYESIKDIRYEFLGSLDGDVSFKPTYYEHILQEFDRNPQLGIASGVYFDEVNGQLRKIRRANISTSGAIQLFRSECYQEIGGYVPLKYGGDDSLADIMARMHGWETRSFPQYRVLHHRPVGTKSDSGILHAKFHQGLLEQTLGTHPAFMLAKSIPRIFWERPFVGASIARMMGYFYAHLRRDEKCVPDEVVKFIRTEQMRRLTACFCLRKSKVPPVQ